MIEMKSVTEYLKLVSLIYRQDVYFDFIRCLAVQLNSRPFLQNFVFGGWKWLAGSLQVPLQALTACDKNFTLKVPRVLYL